LGSKFVPVSGRVLLRWTIVGLTVAFVLTDVATISQWVRTSTLGEVIHRQVARITTNGWKDFRVVGFVFANGNVSVMWKSVRVQHGDDPGPIRSNETTWSQQRARVGESEPGEGPAWVRRLGLRWKYRYQKTPGSWSMTDRMLWMQISFANLLLLSLLAKLTLLSCRCVALERVCAGAADMTSAPPPIAALSAAPYRACMGSLQWTEPAGKLVVVREPARRRLGH
jgi:hypothetical protein